MYHLYHPYHLYHMYHLFICINSNICIICIVSPLPREKLDNLSIFKDQSNIRTVATMTNDQTYDQTTM